MYYYKNPTTHEVRELTEQEIKYFDGMIAVIGKGQVHLAVKALSKYPFLPHAYNEKGLTLLSYAVIDPNDAGVQIAGLLVQHGADVYHTTNRGVTIFDILSHDLSIGDMSQEIHDAFCRAIDLRDAHGNPTTDTAAIVESIIAVKAAQIAHDRVEARWAAKDTAEAAAEAARKPSASEAPDSLESAAYERATAEYFKDPEVQRAMEISRKIRSDFVAKAVTEIIENESAREAIEDLISSKKSDQTIFSVTDDLESLLDNMFSSKNSVIDGISQVLSKLLDIGVEGNLVTSLLIGIENMLTLAGSGHQFMGRPHGFDDFPDGDDFAGFGSGSVAGYLDNLPAPEYSYVVTVLGNGTWVIAEGKDPADGE